MHLRVLSYNIHKCIGGLDRRYRPERIAQVLQHHDADIVLLQEVDRGAKRSASDDQDRILAKLAGYPHRAWFPNVKVRGGGEYGNAILSRFALSNLHNLDVTVGPKKKRSVLCAKTSVPLPGGHSRTVHLFNMHLGLSQIERKMQLRRFLSSEPFAGIHAQTPILLGGDLNDVYGNLGKKLLAPAGFQSHRVRATFPAYAPVRSLDGIYVRGTMQLDRLARSRLALAKRASDHLPLVAELTLSL